MDHSILEGAEPPSDRRDQLDWLYIAPVGDLAKISIRIFMTELVTTVADKIDRAVQRVTPLAYRIQRRGRRWMRRALRKPRSVSEGPNLLPLLIQVLASFSKADGVLLEEEIDSSLGFLRYDYPEAVYSELRQLFRQALYEQQDLSAMAQKLVARARARSARSCSAFSSTI